VLLQKVQVQNRDIAFRALHRHTTETTGQVQPIIEVPLKVVQRKLTGHHHEAVVQALFTGVRQAGAVAAAVVTAAAALQGQAAIVQVVLAARVVAAVLLLPAEDKLLK